MAQDELELLIRPSNAVDLADAKSSIRDLESHFLYPNRK